MIYTSYFAKIKDLPENVIPISICGKAPDWYKGLQYKKLAPKYNFFKIWQETHDNNYYIERYNEEVLSQLVANIVVMELKHLCDKSMYSKADICLICYEKPGDFCHRHLVADWLEKNGFECKEYSF